MTARKPTTRGRKVKTVTEEILPPSDELGEPSDFDISMESVEDSEKLNEVLSQFGETHIRLKIFRKTPGEPEYCYQSEVLDEEFIQKNFGGGDYQVRIYIQGVYRKTMPIRIASRLNSPTPSEVTSGNGGTSMDHHSQFLEKMLLALLNREPHEANPGPSLADMTAALSNLDALRGKQESGIDMVMKGIELAKSMNGETDWKTDLIRTAKEVIPDIMTSFGKQPPMQPNNPRQQVAAPSPDEIVKQAIVYLKQLAVAGVSPETIVEMAVAHGNSPQYQPIIHSVITQEFAEFAKLDPEIGTEPFFSWFRPVFDGLRSAFSPQNSMDDDSAGDMGDPGNTGNHGEPRPAGDTKPKSK